MEEINIYCDESCHLKNDKNDIMVIGGIWIPKNKRKEICEQIRYIKQINDIPLSYELKWVKASKIKRRAYIDLINYFFNDDDIHFRGVVVHGKNKLDFSRFSGDYDDWYYKIYYTMISQLLSSDKKFNIYLDIKDTNSSQKLLTLKDVISHKSNAYKSVINNVQVIRSEEVEIMQLTDVIIGALSYFHRNLNNSSIKNEIIDIIKSRYGRPLDVNSYIRDDKFNILMWYPR